MAAVPQKYPTQPLFFRMILMPPKVVQERKGRVAIEMIMDACGHLFPRADDAKEMPGNGGTGRV